MARRKTTKKQLKAATQMYSKLSPIVKFFIILFVIILLAGGAGAYYFLIYKPTNQVFTLTIDTNINQSSNNTQYKIGDEVTLNANTIAGYDFVEWQLDGVYASNTNPYIFTLTKEKIGTYTAIYAEKPSPTVAEGDISIHFLELGNKYTGDCIYIKAGETDILVDGGSRTNSVSTITNYINEYVTDGKLEYAIITHADQDHIACWAGDNSNSSLFELYDIDTIIDFPMTDKTSATYNRYVLKRDAKAEAGSNHYTALDCYNNENGGQREYTLSEGIKLKVLYNYFYENSSSDENNYSVCFLIEHGSNNYLFTGDLEKKGEEYLVQYNNLPEVTLFKAGHHGSGTSNTETLLSVIKPQYVAITCVAGSTEYSHNKDNTFPYQTTCDKLAKYTDNVFVTSCMDLAPNGNENKYDSYGDARSLNGNIVFSCKDNVISFTGSNNSTKLKDSDWFKTYRTTPENWA